MKRRDFIKAAGVMALAPAGLAAQVSEEAGADIEERARSIVAKMSLAEKVDQMTPEPYWLMLDEAYDQLSGRGTIVGTAPNKRLGLAGIRFMDGPRGPNRRGSTCFPVSMARGAAFDVDLEERIGRAIGYEMAAQGANFTGALCINVLRHPSWGRAQETFGEDPYHLGQMGVASMRGLQEHVMACAKHYACNSIEESRFFVNVKVDERTLREVYLPHFKKCVDNGVASIMSAYNDVNGELCSHNEHLLRDILKGDWGFEGFVISDFFYGVEDTAEAANGGLDVEMPMRRHYGKKLERAVKAQEVSESVIDEAALRIVRQKLRFAHLEDRKDYDKSMIAGPEHAALALEAARKGTVLLKNEGPLLPFDRGRMKSLAVIGRLAKKVNLGDKGSSVVRPPYSVTPLEGIKKLAGPGLEVVYAGSDKSAAARAAGEADAAVVVAGFDWRKEGEYIREANLGGDREDLRLSPADEELIKAVADANRNVAVIIESGSAVIMESWKDEVPAVLMAWYPGMEGGTALAEILFGDISPSGKLPMVMPRSLDQLPPFDNKAREVVYDYYHGYKLLDKNGLEPAFHFGHGLSYARFEYGKPRLSSATMDKNGEIVLAVDVTNAGEKEGEEVVQLYVGAIGSRVDRPEKELKGFARVHLEPGRTGTVTMTIRAAELAYYDVEEGEWVVESISYKAHVGGSSKKEDLATLDFKIV